MRFDSFHAAVAQWFESTFFAPTPCQQQAWPAIKSGRHTLISAPTGAGKTLAAFLAAIDDLVQTGLAGNGLEDQTYIVYVSPLKALSNDINKNLETPLAGIRDLLLQRACRDLEIRTLVRTGDTPAAQRAAMRRRPPHILVTTPESLYILLTSDSGRAALGQTRTVIVDEIHAVAGSKRGAHLALSLERLCNITPHPLLRIGLSATQNPIAEAARFLVGAGNSDGEGRPDCHIVDTGQRQRRDLALGLPDSPLAAVLSNDTWSEIYRQLETLILSHGTTLIFVNTRRMAERVAHQLSAALGTDAVTSHHGSLSREQRLSAEQRLKNGNLRALVATASLELGIDIGHVDLVCQLGSCRTIATLLQRAGRAGHSVGGLPKARLFPLSRDELVEAAALLDAIRRDELDRLHIPHHPLDVLSQQIVAMVACEEWHEDALFGLLRRAWPYRGLTRADFDDVVRMLAEGISTRRGRQSAFLHRDGINHRLRARRGAKLIALTCGGTIPDAAAYEVREEPHNTFIGTLDEDFAIESLAGDIFQLGNTSWRIIRVEPGVVRVADARGQPPNIPFWFGEAPARSDELSFAVSRLRAEIAARAEDLAGVTGWLSDHIGIGAPAAGQLVDYLLAGRQALGAVPTQQTLVVERFFDESGGMQLVVHSPFGSRINRAWGLALRKRFCRKFNFELQAAANEDAIVISLGETHSFPLAEVRHYLHSNTVEDVLTQAVLDAPLFTARFRWNATCALAIPRFRNGKRVPPRLQRMNADDLTAVIFPDRLACLENIAGERVIPEHPLVQQTLYDCLHEAMDVDGLRCLLAAIETDAIAFLVRDVSEPSPLAQEILSAKPYAFLDNAPLEERRTQAVVNRRWTAPETAADMGRLSPLAIERVCAEAWPEARTHDELHDALLTLGAVTVSEIAAAYPAHCRPVPASVCEGWEQLLEMLLSEGRAVCLRPRGGETKLWIAAEHLPQMRMIYPEADVSPVLRAPDQDRLPDSPEQALTELIRGRLQGLGPVTLAELCEPLALKPAAVTPCLLCLEAEGFVMQGEFRGTGAAEWCERRLLARIHRYTIDRLRREIEPVSRADFMRFLLHRHHLAPGEKLEGADSVLTVLEQLEAFPAPALAWEQSILEQRVRDYQPAWLDLHCLSGQIGWLRVCSQRNGNRPQPQTQPVKTTPIGFFCRSNLKYWRDPETQHTSPADLSPPGAEVHELLRRNGACFLEDIAAALSWSNIQARAALAELVAGGHACSDGFSGLRELIASPNGRYRAARAIGRWSIVDQRGSGTDPAAERERRLEIAAQTLLRRYGIACGVLLARESMLPPWRELLPVLRRLEARGEVRGGRFIAGMSGEQFALPETIGVLRKLRRERETTLVALNACDPLNLTGTLLPEARVSAVHGNRILLHEGRLIAFQQAQQVVILTQDPVPEWDIRNALSGHLLRLPA